MNLIDMTNKERFTLMRKRHKFLHDMAKEYTSLEEFAKDKDEWFALVGDELKLHKTLISIDMWLDYGEYEMYYIIPDGKGHLTVSELVSWQDDCCANSTINIFTLEGADDEEILSSIHYYSES